MKRNRYGPAARRSLGLAAWARFCVVRIERVEGAETCRSAACGLLEKRDDRPDHVWVGALEAGVPAHAGRGAGRDGSSQLAPQAERVSGHRRERAERRWRAAADGRAGGTGGAWRRQKRLWELAPLPRGPTGLIGTAQATVSEPADRGTQANTNKANTKGMVERATLTAGAERALLDGERGRHGRRLAFSG